jgi:EAL domain-containing protein (putative c-di-GMP-specific phosphodiesterase class I)
MPRQHLKRRWVLRNEFIPLAEQCDRILKLGAFATRQALGDVDDGPSINAGGMNLYVTVNLSARRFHGAGLKSIIEGGSRLRTLVGPAHH